MQIFCSRYSNASTISRDKNFIGAKVPVIEGASFASVSAMIAIANTYPGDPITAITTILELPL